LIVTFGLDLKTCGNEMESKLANFLQRVVLFVLSKVVEQITRPRALVENEGNQ
jgi:hypothetical protein